MKNIFTAACIFCFSMSVFAQKTAVPDTALPVKWEELTAPDFIKAVQKSGKVCIIPWGIMEKHGPHLPLGTDLIVIRDISVAAAKQNYAVVFPEFYTGQIDVARPQPGTIAYSPDLVWKMLEETCDEIARNGFDKIIIANGHGGNISLLNYFAQTRLHESKPYSLYYSNVMGVEDSAKKAQLDKIFEKMPANAAGGHAGTEETSIVMAMRPELVKTNVIKTESGENLDRLKALTMTATGIDWYAKFPNHYSGDAQYSTKELGMMIRDAMIADMVKRIQQVKADQKVKELQQQFYPATQLPLNTKQ